MLTDLGEVGRGLGEQRLDGQTGGVRVAFAAGIAVAQPDISHAGGISEVRRIAAQAETHDAFLAPHCPLGPVALAWAMEHGYEWRTPVWRHDDGSLAEW